MRLIDFARVTNGLDVIRSAVAEGLKAERTKVEKVAAEQATKETTEKKSLRLSQLKEVAPITRYLLQQALIHMINICSNPALDVAEAKSKVLRLEVGMQV